MKDERAKMKVAIKARAERGRRSNSKFKITRSKSSFPPRGSAKSKQTLRSALAPQRRFKIIFWF